MAAESGSGAALRTRRGARYLPADLETREKWLGFFIFLPVILLFSIFFAYPLVYGIALSFYKLNTLTLSGPFIGLDNFRNFLVSADVRNAMGNSLYWTIA